MALVMQLNRGMCPVLKLRRFPCHSSSALPLHARTGLVIYSPSVGCLSGEAACNVPVSSPETKKIPWSDVVVKQPARRMFSRDRKLSSVDATRVVLITLAHVLCMFAPFTFSMAALWTAVVLYIVGGLGISLSFHRNLAHRSFTLPKWLEYSLAYWGVMAVQWDPIDWVSSHRCHHQHCDSGRDPHSPTEGFWHSYIGWLFDTVSTNEKRGGTSNVADLAKQPFYRFLQRTYLVHVAGLALLLYTIGGFPFVVWGMGVRNIIGFHATMMVNSVCHVWGQRAWNTRDLSRNNGWLAVLSFGEGWHNNHHAFQHSARFGLEWWEMDMAWYVVWLLQAMGLATDVKTPSELQRQRMSLTPIEGSGGSSTLTC